MAKLPKPPEQQVFRDPDTAPFVYFDGATTYGVLSGTVQIELVSRIVRPGPNSTTSTEFITTGRLRCSPNAAASLREALNKALQSLQQPGQGAAAGGIINAAHNERQSRACRREISGPVVVIICLWAEPHPTGSCPHVTGCALC